MRYFSGSDVVRVLQPISQKVLTQWVDRRLVIPTIRARGRGTKNEFTLIDVIRIAIMQRLNELGLSRESAAAIAFCSSESKIGAQHLSTIEHLVDLYQRVIDPVVKPGTSILGDIAALTEHVYMVIVPVDDVPGKVAIGYYVTGETGFMKLYRELGGEDAHVLNLTKIVKKVVDGLRGV
ncbi:MAG: hypothetical protein ACLQBD_02010 [Syntrophobacteraceae bacterium]